MCYVEPLGSDSNKVYSDSDSDSDSTPERTLCHPQPWMLLSIDGTTMEEVDTESALEELSKAIGSLTSGKAPGSDGIPPPSPTPT